MKSKVSNITVEVLKLARRLKTAYKMSLDEAYRFMGLSPDSTPEEVKHKYRKLSIKYHPDRGGDPEQMKKLNVAREVIEGGGTRPSSSPPPADEFDERRWEKYRSRYGPQPSGNYANSDIDRFAQDVLDKGLLQTIYRYEVDHVPVDAGTVRGGRWTYYRPFGGKTKTRRLPKDIDANKLAEAIKAFVRGKIFDMVVKDKEAWITFDKGKKYQSISFEEPKKRTPKPKGVGMKPDAVSAYLKEKGLAIVAGGSKYAYWGPKGYSEKTGYFLREAKRSLRPVHRERAYTGIEDNVFPTVSEVYYGKMTPAILDKWAKWVLWKANAKIRV